MRQRWVYLRQGGLMEDPEWHWEKFFKTSAVTIKQACEERAAIDRGFAVYYNPEQVTYYGWRMAFEDSLKF